MNRDLKEIVRLIFILALGPLFIGCGGPKQVKSTEPTVIRPGTTIGSLAEVVSPDYIPVQGYALAGELKGTGSAECRADIRNYLTRYIRKELAGENIDNLINSTDTAVVLVEGMMPVSTNKNEVFDLRVRALPDTQTTSLESGQLYGAELRAAGSMGISTKVLAYAEGPIYIDKLDRPASDKRAGFVLAGGRTLDDYKIRLAVRQPDYLVANAIRNKLIERFGSNAAKAISEGQVEVQVPPKYNDRKQRFISIIKAIVLVESQQDISGKIEQMVKNLAVSTDKEPAEIVLQAFGNQCLGKLNVLLNSADEEVRFRAARCILDLGSDAGFGVLREIALDKSSSYRFEALRAITAAAKRNDASAISRRLLRDESFEMRLAAYEQLRKLDDIALTRTAVGRNFYLEQVAGTRDKSIFVSRSGIPRIVLFGGPLYCGEDIFVQTDDGDVTINALPGQKYVSIIRKVPQRPTVVPITLKSTYELSSIIQILGDEPAKKSEQGNFGLGVSYIEIMSLLKKMVEKNSIEAEFHAGNLPQIGLK